MTRALIGSLLLLAGAALGAPASAQELPAFEIVMQDGRFTPERLEVPAGKRLKLVLKNEGRTAAEFENLGMRVENVTAWQRC